LISCYHFGYHEEHHELPHLGWWQLPAARRQGIEGRL
jgi:beta-carotene/zeaxanthin 4-ketolase